MSKKGKAIPFGIQFRDVIIKGKAFDVGKERVKKAVAAANKSANAARVAAVKAVQNQMHLSNNIDETEILSV
jgi:hypothetical protein